MTNAFGISARHQVTARAALPALLVMIAVSGLATFALGCSAELEPDEGELGVSVAALSVCEETVPANRYIDGIPAYAQCSASMTTAIFSNDGINTSTTAMGADWVRTQYSGGYQCTELAHRYLLFRWDIDWVPRGNAGAWCDTQPPANIGIVQTTVPVHGDVMVLAPGSCGASSSTGHATVVDVANGESLSVVEQNGARRGTYKTSCAKCFLHVVANDGTPGSIPDPENPPVGTPTAGSAAPPPTTPPVTTPPAQPPVTTPPPTVPPPGMPMAGAAAPAPAPANPVPVTAPPAVPPPVAAPMTAAPAMPSFVPPTTEQPATESTCSISRGAVGRATAGSRATLAFFAFGALGWVVRRRRAI
ncbi:MAG TPA: hypothetical protein VK509_10695 [Polyangiales bacterium]|nr:hypothetical protein [Polyangiales bacterium]